MIRREPEADEVIHPIPEALPSTAGDRELRAFVERSLGSPVSELVRRRLPQTSFPCEALLVRAGGRTHELFFKDYGSCRLPRADAGGPAREIEVYRSILDPEALGTPRHVGSSSEEGRAWLLLEHVRGAPLAKGDPAPWLAAAAWLARLQERPVPEGARPALVVHDAAHLLATAQQAVRTLASIDLVLERRLQNVLEHHEAEAEWLADQPRTLVHGSYRPENLLVDASASPLRLAPVDWEYAALGSALYDVAFLTANRGREKAEGLLRVFAAAAAERGLALPAAGETWELVTILRVHKVLRSLGRSRSWAYSRETVESLIEQAGKLELELDSARRERAHARVSVPDLPHESVAHPSLRAWRTLGFGPGQRPEVVRLEGRYFGRRGRVVYRLGPIGPGGMRVVVKRGRCEKMENERHVYQDVVPRMGVAGARCLGWVEEAGSGWLFLEDVGTSRLIVSEAEHRRAGLAWLARLHRASREVVPDGLPERGAHGYRELLVESRQAIQAALANPALEAAQHARLCEVIETCARVEAGWERIAATCARMPASLVHGDFRPKNIYMQQRDGVLVALPIDWEYSGWGVPACDLGSLLRDYGAPDELAPYLEELALPGLDEAEAWNWVLVGRVFRAVSSIHWTRTSLAYPFLQKPVHNLGVYRAALARAFDGLGPSTAGAPTP